MNPRLFSATNPPHNPKGKSTTITTTNIFLLQILLVAMLECTTFFLAVREAAIYQLQDGENYA